MASTEHLPPHLEFYDKTLADGSISTHYRYIFPDGKRRSLGQNLSAAVKAARILNDRTAEMREQQRIANMLKKVDDPLAEDNPPFSKVADLWIENRLDRLRPSSQGNRIRHITKLKAWFGDLPIQSITTYDLSRRFDLLTAHSCKAHRNAAMQIWKYAQQRGYTNVNPVMPTEAVKPPARVRKRHTWEGYQAVLAAAPEWLQYTMQLALYCLQRESDLANLRWDKVDFENNTLEVRQEKTGTWLKITMGAELRATLEWFRNQPFDCPYVVARKPKCRTKVLMEAVREGRQHFYQVNPDTISKAFSAARDASGYYDHLLPVRTRPAFHDLRALGIFALVKAGYPEKYIQALAGHASIEMTHHYIEGHEQERPVEVEAGLSISAVDWSDVDWNETVQST